MYSLLVNGVITTLSPNQGSSVSSMPILPLASLLGPSSPPSLHWLASLQHLLPALPRSPQCCGSAPHKGQHTHTHLSPTLPQNRFCRHETPLQFFLMLHAGEDNLVKAHCGLAQAPLTDTLRHCFSSRNLPISCTTSRPSLIVTSVPLHFSSHSVESPSLLGTHTFPANLFSHYLPGSDFNFSVKASPSIS